LNAPPSPKYPVFIIGSPRSGTSILVDALYSAGYKGYREGSFLSLITGIAQVIDRHYAAFADGNDSILISHIDQAVVKQQIFDVLKSLIDDRNPHHPWFDKTGNPEMILAVPVLRKLWPDSAFVFAKRRAIENIMSRMKKFPKHTFEYHCSDWARNMATWRTVRDALPEDRYTEIDQQEMIQKPEEAARKLRTLLGLESEKEEAIVETFKSNRPQQTETNSAARLFSLTTTGWQESQCEIFRKHCATEMAIYGYSMDEGYNTAPTSG
jgi:hypothetical protein